MLVVDKPLSPFAKMRLRRLIAFELARFNAQVALAQEQARMMGQLREEYPPGTIIELPRKH